MNDQNQTVDEPGREQTPDNSPPQPERIGRYQVKSVLGQGRFGIVYLAHDDQLQRLVAITVPHARLISRPEDTEAYLTEARTVASLDHPNIVPVYDVGSTQDCPCFVVSKYIEGQTLREFYFAKNPTPIESSRILVKLADALDVAHQRNLYHLNLGPNKILVDAENTPFLMREDFIRVERLAGDHPVYGHPAYCSPEQVAGEAALIGSASDIFSFGVVLYEMLTGRRPYRSDGLQVCEEILHAPIEPPSRVKKGIPSKFDKICATSMAKSPAARYQRMADFANALRVAEAS